MQTRLIPAVADCGSSASFGQTRASSAAVVVSATLMLTACGSALEYRENRNWNTAAVYTTADTRIVTQRQDPLGGKRSIICTEPLPDVAKALAHAVELQASGGDGTVNANLSGAVASSQALTELSGRSTALLGLRDGLYRTCEAYANGALGDAAYALVLGRYGQLMATLFLSQDIQASTLPPLGTASAPSPSPPSSTTGKSDTPPPKPTPTPAKADPSVPSALARPIAFAPASPAKAATPGPSADGTNQNAAAAQASSGTPAAQAILQMHKAYLDLDGPAGLLHLLLVVCINEQDPTRPGRTQLNRDAGFVSLCASLPGRLQTILDQALGTSPRPPTPRGIPARR